MKNRDCLEVYPFRFSAQFCNENRENSQKHPAPSPRGIKGSDRKVKSKTELLEFLRPRCDFKRDFPSVFCCENGHLSLADTGVLPLTSASFWTSSLGRWLANTRHSTTLAFRKLKPCSDRSLHANGVTQLLGDGRLSSELPEGLRCSPLYCGR